MSVQATVLIDGEWSTRTVDIGQLLARNREAEDREASLRAQRPPITGILSRTLIHAPAIRWILPARLRHQELNDVVFVGDHFIQIKQILPGGPLQDVITKDFDATIIGAKTIDVQLEPTLEDEIRRGAESQFSNNGSNSITGQDLPAHILVLVLSTKDILFVYTKSGPGGIPIFIYSKRPLPTEVSSLEEYGRHIAIDPRSRMMAISAAHNFFGVFSLKSRAISQTEMALGWPVNPILEERFFRAEGDILKIEFLYPPASDNDKVVLLLVIAREGQLFFMWYDWSALHSLRFCNPRIGAQILPNSCSSVSVLIPLMNTTSFLIATSSMCHIYKNIVDSESSIIAVKYPIPPLDHLPKAAKLLWTHWARPMRNSSRNQQYDDLYLCREDGKILYLEIGKTGEIHRQSRLGSLAQNIDTAVAILPGGYEAGDLLVTAGSMCGGGLYIEDARQPPRCIQRLPNWGPIIDSLVLKAEGFPGQPTSTFPRRTTPSYKDAMGRPFDRIFTCSGIGLEHGTITELRYGIEAQIGLLIEQADASSITGIWAFPAPADDGTYCLATDPLSTSVIYIPNDSTKDIYALDADNSHLELDRPTLAAGINSDGVIYQVTDQNICLRFLEDRQHYSEPDECVNFIIATVNGQHNLVATIQRVEKDLVLAAWKADTDEDGKIFPRCFSRFTLPATETQQNNEPTCLAINKIKGATFLFVGTGDGKISVYAVTQSEGIYHLFDRELIMADSGDEDPHVCESMRFIQGGDHWSRQFTLLCGLRSGNLVALTLQFTPTGEEFDLVQSPFHKLGDTPVRIKGFDYDPSFVVVSCGVGFWKLSLPKDLETQYVLDKIWITDQNNPARMQPHVEIFYCVDPQHLALTGGLEKTLMCVSGKQIFACSLGTITKAVPRSVPVPGSPKRLIYSEYLKKIVVAYNTAEYETFTGYTKRWIRPRIGFLDPNEESMTPVTDTSSGSELDASGEIRVSSPPTGASGEKITALLDWRFSGEDGKEYHLMVLGTSHPLAIQKGRVIYIKTRPSRHAQGCIDCIVKTVHVYDHSVAAIAAFGSSSLIFAIGDEVRLQTLDPATKKWRKMPAYRLESTITSLSVLGERIYALTARHSLCILEMTDKGLVLAGQAGADREGLHHLHVPGESMTFTANKGGALIGLSDPLPNSEQKLLPPTFAAHMHASMIRLNRSSRSGMFGGPETIIYGTTIEGSVYRFSTLKEKEWRLLRYIQNTCMQDQTIYPFRKSRRTPGVDELNPSFAKPEFMHIDGDVLSRLSILGAGYLKDMMQRTNPGDPAGGTQVLSGLRLQKFLEFVHAVFGNVNDPYSVVAGWMERILRVEL
ncbi:hypothetical protein FQN57_007439 [Myotisia sp. PD_48]|nr:hypothetical protein FQN57_007439 [Myotisia sp. PD_48]